VDAEPIELLPPSQIEDAQADPDDTAVERHAAIPEAQYLGRTLEIFARLVEQDVAEAAAEDDAQCGVEDEIVGMAPRHRGAGLLQQLQQIPPAEDDPGEISEAVPAQRERAEMDQHRVDAERPA
jgi:hypothetical protein